MKIITNNAIFIQKNDIMMYLHKRDMSGPSSILMKVFEEGVVIIDDTNKYDFVRFDTHEEIEFFKSLDWIIDYNQVKDLTEEEIYALGRRIIETKNALAIKFNEMSKEQKEENQGIVAQCELLDFKLYSLRDILWLKQGHLKMNLPEGVPLPTNLEQEKGIKKLIRTLFNKNEK